MEERAGIGTFKDPVSAMTHFGGFVAAVIGTIAIVALSVGDAPKLTIMAIYGLSLSALMLASAAYHFFDISERANLLLRRADHAAIFLLIAGSYGPPLLHMLDGWWRIGMFAFIGGVAVVGAVIKLAWMSCPSWLTITMYLAMGWGGAIMAPSIVLGLDGLQLGLLVTGGLAYSVGAIVYAAQWPDPLPKRFGSHEIWHIFVLAGAGSHFGFVVTFLWQPYAPF